MKFAALGDMGRYRSAQRERCLKSRDLKGTIGGDIRLHTISNDPRRYRLVSISYILLLPCHGLRTQNYSGLFVPSHPYRHPWVTDSITEYPRTAFQPDSENLALLS